MNLFNKLYFILFAFTFLVSCATVSPVRTTESNYLAKVKDIDKDFLTKILSPSKISGSIQEKICRSTHVKKKNPFYNSKGERTSDGFISSDTVRISLCPYTELVLYYGEMNEQKIRVDSVQNKVEELKTKEKAEKKFKEMVNSKISSKQCFDGTIVSENSDLSDSLVLKFWDFSLSQNNKTFPISVTSVSDKIKYTQVTFVDKYSTHSYEKDFTVTFELCTKDPINLMDSFEFKITPRYHTDLLDVHLGWLRPEK